MCSEASFLSSGFGTYAKEILTRLYNTNKYDIAEFASYGMVNDPRDNTIPWKYYANAVKEDDPRHKEYSSRADNQFGRWRFEKVLLDFKPDIVIDIRDYWMSSYQAISPLRKFFHWILMPTVDSEPQQEEWVDTFLSADSVFTYSDWGAEVLKKQSSNKINYISTASPGVDLDTFKILDNKEGIKEKLGVPKNSIIFGSVMRNQKRKLIPELMSSFRQVLDFYEINNPDIGKNIYLYLHTSYPDMGWDIPELLRQNRIGNKTLFTYACRKCSFVQSSVFVGPMKTCPQCLNKSMSMPTVTSGIGTDKLAEIYNIFDTYIQYSICEGFGMPQVEAAACGIPIITINYSAMVDIINKLGAISIEPKTKFKELETKAIRVYPDNDQLCNEIIKICSMDLNQRRRMGENIRKLTEKHYSWDHIAKIWEEHLDLLDNNYRSNWDAPPQYLSYNITNADKIDQKDFYEATAQIFDGTLNDEERICSMQSLSMLQNADYGFAAYGTNIQPSNYESILDHIKTEIGNINESESARSKNLKFNDDFIQYAHIKNNT